MRKNQIFSNSASANQIENQNALVPKYSLVVAYWRYCHKCWSAHQVKKKASRRKITSTYSKTKWKKNYVFWNLICTIHFVTTKASSFSTVWSIFIRRVFFPTFTCLCYIMYSVSCFCFDVLFSTFLPLLCHISPAS